MIETKKERNCRRGTIMEMRNRNGRIFDVYTALMKEGASSRGDIMRKLADTYNLSLVMIYKIINEYEDKREIERR